MTATVQQQIQSACDDLYRDPNDENAFGRLRRLLGARPGDAGGTVGGVVSQHTWRRLVKTACNEVYDDPENNDARDLLLLLLTAARR